MRFQTLTRYFDEHAALFLAGDLAGAAQRFITPVPVYLEEGLLVLPDPCAVVQALGQFRTALRADGITRMTCDVAAAELPKRGTQQVWLAWHYFSSCNRLQRSDKAIYILRDARVASGAKIESVHYTRLAYPNLAGAFMAGA